MARGQLGISILAHFQVHSEPQTVKQIQDALQVSSGGAIGYALDKLTGEGKMVKLGERPARYTLTTVTARIEDDPGPDPQAIERDLAERYPSEEEEGLLSVRRGKGKARKSGPCGYCMTTKTMQYHLDHCPVTIPRAQAGENWDCPCAPDHERASDYAEYQAELKADAAERVARVEEKIAGGQDSRTGPDSTWDG